GSGRAKLGLGVGRQVVVMALAPQRAPGELRLQLGRVEQNQTRELDGPVGRVDRSSESARDEMGDKPAMIEMGVGEKNSIEVTRRPGRESDAELFVRWFADMEVTRMLGRRMAIALYQEQEFLKKIGESKDDVWWAIEAEGKAIGASGIHAINWIDANATTGTM